MANGENLMDLDLIRELHPGEREYAVLDGPAREQTVWPHQLCPCFACGRAPRMPVPPIKACWSCDYAQFPEDVTIEQGIIKLDAGTCRYPNPVSALK